VCVYKSSGGETRKEERRADKAKEGEAESGNKRRIGRASEREEEEEAEEEEDEEEERGSQACFYASNRMDFFSFFFLSLPFALLRGSIKS
jgi:hypothetical protein